MNRNKFLLRLTALAVLAVLMLGMGTSALAASMSARINSSSAKVYSAPSASGKYVSGGKGVKVTITAYNGSWSRISYRGNTGYIQTKYLNLTDRIKAYTGKSTAVYKQATSSSSRMGTLPIGTAVYVVGRDGSYFRIQNASGSVTGYVSGSNLTTREKLQKAYDAYKAAQEAENNASSGSSSSGSASTGTGTATGSTSVSKIDKVISLAKSLVGRPYAVSANPPASFNCSTFVKYCMGKYGYSFEGTAAAQANMSNKVSKDSIQKGDVLCFDTDGDGTCDHTAIYLGSNRFIEASQNAGKVQINSLDTWYKNRLMHAIRPK